MFRAGEDQTAVKISFLEERDEEFEFKRGAHGIKSVGDGFINGASDTDLDASWIAQRESGDGIDLGRNGGGEK